MNNRKRRLIIFDLQESKLSKEQNIAQ